MGRPALPNSPLVEVVYEIRFHGDLSLFSSWAGIQRRLRGEFPKLYVPGAAVGLSPLLQPVRLASPDDYYQVLLAINSFAFLTKRYDTFDDFTARFTKTFGAFTECCGPDRMTRFGLRYVNSLPPAFDKERAKGQLHPCLRLGISGWGDLPDAGQEQPQLVLQGQAKASNLRIALLDAAGRGAGTLPSPFAHDAVTGVQFDLDYYTTENTRADRVRPFLEEAHSAIDSAFFSMITDEYHSYLRGE